MWSPVLNTYSTSFNAKAHIRQLENIFHYFQVNVHEFALFLVFDSCALNKYIAKKIEISQVGCANHKLAPDVSTMVWSPALKHALDYVRITMPKCNASIKNRAKHSRLTNVALDVPCATRWSGTSSILSRFMRIWHYLDRAADTDGLELRAHLCFEINATSWRVYWKKWILDGERETLQLCRFRLDVLHETLLRRKNNPSATLYGFLLRDKHTKLSSLHFPELSFELGVIKIQRSEVETIADAERTSV